MKIHEAKFLLRARRPGQRDAGDRQFAEALAEAERDPLLKLWHEREERFDAAMAQKLAGIAPPPGLREAILAGARATARARPWWREPRWLAAAAGFAILAAVGSTLALRGGALPADRLAAAAFQDLSRAHDGHDARPPGLAEVQTQLADPARPVRQVALDLETLQRTHCRAVRIGGHEVFEICFLREGVWFHLYATRGSNRGGAFHELAAGSETLVAATWSDARNSYALVTSAGREALRRVL